MSPMTVGDAWSSVLPLTLRQALHDASEILIDEFLDEFPAIAAGELAFSASGLGSLLPDKHAVRYTPAFARRFFTTFIVVTWKVAQSRPREPILSCTAEELALLALIQEAEALLEIRNLDFDFEPFKETVLEDFDVELLYDPAVDGVEVVQVSSVMGLEHLKFHMWFTPFNDAKSAIHPYSAEDSEADASSSLSD